ncbi:hypothetical protein [Escherichia coli]|uniref:hypothetical protein n=1 Tax=Escherichia coli TaxID=562 RepID=UPI0023EE1AF8|nr:hypothetical protein [Escherichia coli]
MKKYIQTESYIDQLQTLIILKNFMNERYEEENCEILYTTDNGYPSVVFCGGVYEVSIIPVDYKQGLEGEVMFIASVGNELVKFPSLIDAVESFYSCIDEAIKQAA